MRAYLRESIAVNGLVRNCHQAGDPSTWCMFNCISEDPVALWENEHSPSVNRGYRSILAYP